MALKWAILGVRVKFSNKVFLSSRKMQNREGIQKIEDEKNKDGMKFQWKCVDLIVKKIQHPN